MKILNTMNRVYLTSSELNDAVSFYENIFGMDCSMRFNHEELELASVGSILLIAGPDEQLKKHKRIKTTFLVDSLDEYKNQLLEEGSDILEEPQQVPTGRNMHVRHPDGTVVEYVEHK